ncbi:MAG TPA: hypothetical protein VE011_07050 [Candidatus Dormibacteraeota bacterium]|nr:hypothetical protein [Candidatus Dormibacteraeota bacterium]
MTIAIALGVVAALASARPTPLPTSGIGPSVAPSEQAVVAAPVQIDCRREVVPFPSYLAGDPCPTAVLAVENAVAVVRMPIRRMVILAGPLFCGVIWEGTGSPAICFDQLDRPGQFMHAYVSFVDSPKVAVVMLGLDLPADDNDPAATRPPWQTTLVAIDVPPSGWVMP